MDIKGYLAAPVPRWVALAALVSTGVGTGLGVWMYQKRRYEDAFAEAVAREVNATEIFFKTLGSGRPIQEFATPQEAAAALGVDVDEQAEYEEKVTEYQSTDDSGDRIEVAHNVFTDAEDYEFDLAAEVEKRSPDRPYILEHDEFYESDNQTITLTWFAGDEVLADEKDEHIPDIDRVVGEDNLLRFGHGSRDPNILYVRNEKMDVDFEIVLNQGKYTEQVLGFQHDMGGNRKRVLRMREYDDE